MMPKSANLKALNTMDLPQLADLMAHMDVDNPEHKQELNKAWEHRLVKLMATIHKSATDKDAVPKEEMAKIYSELMVALDTLQRQ